jgi:AraC-like DNA-binding protein
MLYLAGIFITFFLAALLAGKKGKSEADKILALWLLFIGFHLGLFYLYVSGSYKYYPQLLGIEIALPLVHGPFLFLYTTALTQVRKIKAIGLLHFLPLLATYLLMYRFFVLSPGKKVLVYQNKGAGYEWLTGPLLFVIIASGVGYVILSFLKLKKHKVNIENQFSNTDKINLDWLRYLIYGTAAIWIVIISGLNDKYIFGTSVAFVFFIGYFGIKQVGIFSNKLSPATVNDSGPAEIAETIAGTSAGLKENVSGNFDKYGDVAETIPAAGKPKYQKSSLTPAEATKIHEELNKLMLNEKLYKDAELNLGELSEKLDVHSNSLSQVINSFENKNFYDYINHLRIEEFKKLVADPSNNQYTLLSLAFECGFNSKTAFNRNFKKATGLSPSEYLEQVKINLT